MRAAKVTEFVFIADTTKCRKTV